MASATTYTLSVSFLPDPSYVNTGGGGVCPMDSNEGSWFWGTYEINMFTRYVDIDAYDVILSDIYYDDTCYYGRETYNISKTYHNLTIVNERTVTYETRLRGSYSGIAESLESRDKYDQSYINAQLGPGESFELDTESGWSIYATHGAYMQHALFIGGIHEKEHVSNISYWANVLTITIKKYVVISVNDRWLSSGTGATYPNEPTISYFTYTRTIKYDKVSCITPDSYFTPRIGYVYYPLDGNGINTMDAKAYAELTAYAQSVNGGIVHNIINCVEYAKVESLSLTCLQVEGPIEIDNSYPNRHEYKLKIVNPIEIEGDLTVYLSYVGGTAESGIDFNAPTFVVIPEGEYEVLFNIKVLTCEDKNFKITPYSDKIRNCEEFLEVNILNTCYREDIDTGSRFSTSCEQFDFYWEPYEHVTKLPDSMKDN